MKKNSVNWLGLAVLGGVIFFSSAALAAPKALVYKGPGACKEDCSESLYAIAKKAGYDAVYVGPHESDPKIFDGAAVWIQPGGYAGVAMQNMVRALKDNIRNFVNNGGGYVGYCAGAFTATARVGTTRVSGLGIFPGGTKLYGKGIDMLKVEWNRSQRHIYWEGGPYLRYLPKSVEVTAKYKTGAAAAARTSYGKGRVYITGLHPEAPLWWSKDEGMEDIDGTDEDLVVQMLQWVTEAH